MNEASWNGSAPGDSLSAAHLTPSAAVRFPRPPYSEPLAPVASSRPCADSVDQTTVPTPIVSSSSSPTPPTSIEPARPALGTSLMYPGPVFLDASPPNDEAFLFQEHKISFDGTQRREHKKSPNPPVGRTVFDLGDEPQRINSLVQRSATSEKQHGNLAPSEFEYNLYLRPDSSEKTYTQWYFFSVSNFRTGVPYVFNIVNMYKPDSLHNYGMQPVVYSCTDAANGIGWTRGGQHIYYYKNAFKRNKHQFYFTLTFSYTFKNVDDLCYFAHCYPYTYSNLQSDLMAIEVDPERKKTVKRRPLCLTISGNMCELLTITSFASPTEAIRNRKGIVITSRVHPGESCSSWIMRGFINFITGPTQEANYLRENYVFKVIPILNPDGVINGNYRCTQYGDDLNRCWIEPSKSYHPTIYHAKIMIQNFLIDRPMLLFCDMHGHSRKKNVFMYGCGDDNGPKNRGDKVFPRLLELRNHMYSYTDSRFSVQKSKLSTARVVMRREYDISYSYTLEASLAGFFNPDNNSGAHFNINHYQVMGETLCLSLIDLLEDKICVQRLLKDLYASGGCGPQEMDSDDSDYSSYDEDNEGKSRYQKGKKKSKNQKPRKSGRAI